MKFIQLLILSLLTTGIIIFGGCSDDDKKDDNPANTNVASCEGCHTNYDHLKLVASPDTVTVGGGCGGDAPHFEPYDRVHLGGAGWDTFKKTEHYKLGCTACHNGDNKTSDKKVAHGGEFIAKPSKKAQEKCSSCHSEEVTATHNSIHQQGWGQKRKVTMRYGLSGPQDYEALPSGIKDGYDHNCATCHAATCGDCHVNRPKAGGGGLMNGHAFTEPDMVKTCVTCHKSRGGHAFLGVAPGTQPDVHQQKGFTCMSCHKETDVHGTGQIHEQRYAVPGLAQCTDCHSNIGGSNNYHAMHADNLSCNTCHSQDYNSCGSCHVGGEGARILSYQDYKIGMNPLPDLKKNFRMALVRRTPGAPDQWEKFGYASYPNFDKFPTYNFTSPHNIQKWTTRTQVESGKSCYWNCHIVKDGEVIRNKKLYLFDSDLNEWEKTATKPITVDGKLPSSWKIE